MKVWNCEKSESMKFASCEIIKVWKCGIVKVECESLRVWECESVKA